MQILTTFLAYGYLLIVGVIFLIMLLQVLSFYIAGRLTGSINDEFTSALSLFGALFLIGLGSSLVDVGIKTFVPDSILPPIAAAIAFVFITVYVIMKIYDLSVLSSILHFIISFGIMVITLILLGYLATRFIPAGGFSVDLGTTLNSTDTSEFDSLSESEDLNAEESEEDSLEGTEGIDVITVTEEITEEGPKLPGSTTAVGSHKDCDVLTGCESPDETCFADICQTKSEIERNFEFTDNCTSHPCENCQSGTLYDFGILLGSGTTIQLCIECDGGESPKAPCKEGFTCDNYKCVAGQ